MSERIDTRSLVESTLDREVRPYLAGHHGGIEVDEIDDDGLLRLRMLGFCSHCPAAGMTLYGRIESAMLAVPGVERVEADNVRLPPQTAERVRRFFATEGKSRLTQGRSSK